MSFKKNVALFIAGLTFIASNAGNLLPNGSFDKVSAESPDFPAGWHKGIHGKAKADFKLVKRGDGKALQITKLNSNKWVECLSGILPVKLTSTGLIEISGAIKTEAVKSGSIVLIGFDKKGKMLIWKRLYSVKGSCDWKKIKIYTFIPSIIKKLRLSLRVNQGEGSILFDDFKILHIDSALPAGAQLIKKEWLGVYGKNTGKLPVDWMVKSWSAAETRFKVTADRQGACLRWVSGGAKFGVEPELWLPCVPAGTNLKMVARYKVSGKGKAVLMAEFYDKNETKIGEQYSEKGVSSAWSNLSYIFSVPKNTAEMKFYLLNVGRGEVRYISTALTKTAQAGEKKFPITVYCSPAEGNRIIYNGRTLFNTIVDSPNSLSFDFWGERSALKNPALVIEIPVGLKIVECFNSHPTILSAATPKVNDIQIGGKPYKRYIYKNLKAFSLMRPIIRWRRQVVMAFEPVNSNTALPAEFKTWFYMQDDKSKARKRELIVRVLPPLKKLPNPKDFPIYNWADGDMNFLDMPLFMRVIKKYEEANLNSRQREWRPVLQGMDLILEKRGWNMHNPEQDYTETRIVRSLTNNLKDARIAIKHNGKAERHRICPEYFLNDQKFTNNMTKFLTKKYSRIKAKAGDYVVLDYEPWRTMEWCFCPKCREKFSKKVHSNKVLSAKEITSKYSNEWVNFRIEQTAAINRKTAAIIKGIVPGVVMVDYDYPVKFDSPNYRDFYKSVPKDPKSYEDCIDIHFSSFYHSLKKDAFNLIDVNVKNLKRPVYMTPSLSRNDPLQGSYTTNEETLSPEQFRVKILGAACSGCKGICIFPGVQIDGLFFVQINRAMGEIAVVENFLRKGKRQDSKVKLTQRPNRQIKAGNKTINLPKWEPLSGHRVYKLNNEILILIFNFHSRYPLYTGLNIEDELLPKKVSISNAISKCRILPPSGKAFWTISELRQKLLLKIPPMDVKFYILKPYQNKIGITKTKNNKVIHQEYARELQVGKTPAFKPVINGKSKAVMTDVNSDGIPEIEVSTPIQKLTVSLKGGIVLNWQALGITAAIGVGKQKQDSMCWDYFWIPMLKYSSNNQPYKLKNVKCVNGKFLINLQADFKANGLRLAKTFVISTDKPVFTVKYTVTNTATHNTSTSLWSHNFPALQAADKLNDLIFKVGKFTVTGKGKNEQVFTFKDNKVLKFAKQRVMGSFKVPEIICSNKRNQSAIRVKLDPAYLNQVYLYRGNNPTFEWMTRNVTLKPKQSWSTWMQFSISRKK